MRWVTRGLFALSERRRRPERGLSRRAQPLPHAAIPLCPCPTLVHPVRLLRRAAESHSAEVEDKAVAQRAVPAILQQAQGGEVVDLTGDAERPIENIAEIGRDMDCLSAQQPWISGDHRERIAR